MDKHPNSPDYCPRCHKKSIRRDYRKCINPECQGRVLFDGDDAEKVYDWWYMWHKSIFGVETWFDRSYITKKPIHIPANIIGATN
jgi:hypothetical protein